MQCTKGIDFFEICELSLSLYSLLMSTANYISIVFNIIEKKKLENCAYQEFIIDFLRQLYQLSKVGMR